MWTSRASEWARHTGLTLMIATMYFLAINILLNVAVFVVIFAMNLKVPKLVLSLGAIVLPAIGVAALTRLAFSKHSVLAALATSLITLASLYVASVLSERMILVSEFLGVAGLLACVAAPPILALILPSLPPNKSLERARGK